MLRTRLEDGLEHRGVARRRAAADLKPDRVRRAAAEAATRRRVAFLKARLDRLAHGGEYRSPLAWQPPSPLWCRVDRSRRDVEISPPKRNDRGGPPMLIAASEAVHARSFRMA
jgi:hypothetical protein